MPSSGEPDSPITAVLNEIRQTAGLEGIALLDLSLDGSLLCYSSGLCGVDTIDFGRALLAGATTKPSHAVAGDKRPILACPWATPAHRPGGIILWRSPRGRAWGEADYGLAASVALLLRSTLGPGQGEIGLDKLTGLPNRRWFLDEADRHIERLDMDAVVGTLFLVDIDQLRRVNASHGRDTGDRILVRMATQLRSIVRPADLVARVGADEFAMWLDGMDHFTAAERADELCSQSTLPVLPDGHNLTLSVGIASRRPGSAEDIRVLLRRAHMAARDVKAQGGGGWRVSHPEPARRWTD